MKIEKQSAWSCLKSLFSVTLKPRCNIINFVPCGIETVYDKYRIYIYIYAGATRTMRYKHYVCTYIYILSSKFIFPLVFRKYRHSFEVRQFI